MTLADLRKWAADDFLAATHQSMGQYRTALLRVIDHVAATEPFQQRVQPWMLECFGAEIAADWAERNHRFLEEALELVQACGCTASEAHQLVDYVFARPVGEKHQEVGGVMVTLAALCLAQSLDMHAAGETELTRVWTKVEQIRAKQAAKPKHSPLPQPVPTPEPIYQYRHRNKTELWMDCEADEYETFGQWTEIERRVSCTAPVAAENAPVISANSAANTERARIITRAVVAHGRKWPEQLTSGVMFYEGERITLAEFLAEVQA